MFEYKQLTPTDCRQDLPTNSVECGRIGCRDRLMTHDLVNGVTPLKRFMKQKFGHNVAAFVSLGPRPARTLAASKQTFTVKTAGSCVSRGRSICTAPWLPWVRQFNAWSAGPFELAEIPNQLKVGTCDMPPLLLPCSDSLKGRCGETGILCWNSLGCCDRTRTCNDVPCCLLFVVHVVVSNRSLCIIHTMVRETRRLPVCSQFHAASDASRAATMDLTSLS